MMANRDVASKEISVVCGDLDQTMVDLAAERIREKGWPAKAERLDAQVITIIFLHSLRMSVVQSC